MKIPGASFRMIIILLISCAQSSDSGSFSDLFKKLSRAGGYQEAKKFYSAKTVSHLDDAFSAGLISEKQRMRILPLFDSVTRWKEKDIKVEKETAVVKITYTAHPVENMTGYEMTLTLIREGGAWKIDLSDDIKKSLDLARSTDGKKYLREIGFQ